MNMYKLYFVDTPDPAWIKAAYDSLVMPKDVEDLIKGKVVKPITGVKVDAIIEWDKTVTKNSRTKSQLDFWPVMVKG